MRGRLIYLMGPSGAGKDSLIAAAKTELDQRGIRVARRIITRSGKTHGEDARIVTADIFKRMAESGEFVMHWYANDMGYGIDVEIENWLCDGQHVLVNGSRAYFSEALERWPEMLTVLLAVDASILAKRLLARGRETEEQIRNRLLRNDRLQGGGAIETATCKRIETLDNSGELSVTLATMSLLLDHHGFNVIADRI